MSICHVIENNVFQHNNHFKALLPPVSSLFAIITTGISHHVVPNADFLNEIHTECIDIGMSAITHKSMGRIRKVITFQVYS